MYDLSEVLTSVAMVMGLLGSEGVINWMVKLDGSVETDYMSETAIREARLTSHSMSWEPFVSQPVVLEGVVTCKAVTERVRPRAARSRVAETIALSENIVSKRRSSASVNVEQRRMRRNRCVLYILNIGFGDAR